MSTFARSPKNSGQATAIVMMILAAATVSSVAVYGKHVLSARASRSLGLSVESGIVNNSVKQVLYNTQLCTQALSGQPWTNTSTPKDFAIHFGGGLDAQGADTGYSNANGSIVNGVQV